MFRIFYCGKKSIPSSTHNHTRRTDFGNLLLDLRMGLDFYEKEHGKFDPSSIETTHTYIATTTLANKESIFESFQGFNISEKQKVEIFFDTDADHVSMSVGDILVDNNGRVFFCDSIGWKEV